LPFVKTCSPRVNHSKFRCGARRRLCSATNPNATPLGYRPRRRLPGQLPPPWEAQVRRPAHGVAGPACGAATETCSTTAPGCRVPVASSQRQHPAWAHPTGRPHPWALLTFPGWEPGAGAVPRWECGCPLWWPSSSAGNPQPATTPPTGRTTASARPPRTVRCRRRPCFPPHPVLGRTRARSAVRPQSGISLRSSVSVSRIAVLP